MRKLRKSVYWIYYKVKHYKIPIFIILFSTLISSLIPLLIAVFSKSLVDASLASNWEEAVSTGSFFLFVLGVQVFVKLTGKILKTWYMEAMSNEMKINLFQKLTNSYWLDFKKYHTGDIITRITNDTNIITESIMSELPSIIAQSVSFVSAFITFFLYDSFLAVMGLIAGPITLMVGVAFGTRCLSLYARVQEAESKFLAFTKESLEHMLIIKTFSYEEESKLQFQKLLKNKIKLKMKKRIVMGISIGLMVLTCLILYVPILLKMVYEVRNQVITVGDLVTYIQLIILIQMPMIHLSESIQNLTKITASITRIMELEYLDEDVNCNIPKQRGNIKQQIYKLGNIYLENLHFSYVKENPVLSTINAQISPGDVIGLIGKSGEGKTTLVHLIMQILQPELGTITVGEKKILLRDYISYVPQGNTLFSGTIAENLQIACPNATQEDQIEVLKVAGIWDFVKHTDKGLQTVIGERGMGLSEGQAQRIAIARALLKKAPLLILDEATSSLDQETEKKILEEITKDKTRTIILITHRTSLLKYCNRVWKLSKGRLKEQQSKLSEAAATIIV